MPLPLFVRVQKGYSRFAYDRVLEIDHNCNILTPKVMAGNVVSFSFFWCSTGALGSTLLGAGFLYCILSASSLDPNSSGPPRPFGLVWLSLPQHGSNWLQLPDSSNSTELYNRSTPTGSLKKNVYRHQAEITVMQFRGHSLPVHHSVVAQWDLDLVPYYQP